MNCCSIIKFGKKGTLSPRYTYPYNISKRVGNVANELELQSKLAAAHTIFHISMIKKCMSDTSLIVPTENIDIKENLCYEEMPISFTN